MDACHLAGDLTTVYFPLSIPLLPLEYVQAGVAGMAAMRAAQLLVFHVSRFTHPPIHQSINPPPPPPRGLARPPATFSHCQNKKWLVFDKSAVVAFVFVTEA
jgi:hypothetical protein